MKHPIIPLWLSGIRPLLLIGRISAVWLHDSKFLNLPVYRAMAVYKHWIYF